MRNDGADVHLVVVQMLDEDGKISQEEATSLTIHHGKGIHLHAIPRVQVQKLSREPKLASWL